MSTKKILIASISTLLSVSSFAGVEGDVFNSQLSFGWSPIVTLSGGPIWSSIGQAQSIFYSDIFDNVLWSTYYPTKNTDTQGTAEIFFALQREVIHGMNAQLGIQIAGVTSAEINGSVNVNGSPDLYSYSYEINHGRIGFKGKLIAIEPTLVQPYVSGGIAVSFNQSHGYVAIPNVLGAPFTPTFSDYTTVGFSYTLGIGVQKTFYPNWILGIGYEFDNLGKANLGIDKTYPYNRNTKGLNLSNWYAQQLQFSLSYLA